MRNLQKITPCLWFDGRAEEAATYYTGIFPNFKITALTRYGEAGREIHEQAAGTVLTATFELDRQPFTALNGGPQFKSNEAISFQVGCDTQDETAQLSAIGCLGRFASAFAPRTALDIRFRDLVTLLLRSPWVADVLVGQSTRR